MSLSVFGSTLIDGSAGDPTRNIEVELTDDRFGNIRIDPAPHRSSELIDAEGLTLMPGIINAHSHLGAVALLDVDEVPAGVVAAWIFEHCRRSIDLGITTSRETGAIDGGVVRAVDEGIARGPRIIPAGPAIIQTGGHGDFSPTFVGTPCTHHVGFPGLAVLTTIANGPDEVRAAARLAFKRGAKFLKLMVTGGVTSLSDSLLDTQFSAAEIQAAVAEARARHTYVTVHSHNDQGTKTAVANGVECVEHGTNLEAETARAMAAAGCALVPTLTVTRTYARNAAFLPQSVIDRVAGVETGMRNAMKLAADAGVLVGCGSDLIGPDQKDYGMEIPLVAEVFGAHKAIQIATSANARVLRRPDLGRVASGLTADLIAVDGDPIADPWILNDPDRIKLVIKSGQVVKDIR